MDPIRPAAHRRRRTLPALTLGLAGVASPSAPAPSPVLAQDTLTLAAAHAAALGADPRAAERALVDSATALRLDALRTRRLPRLELGGRATWQSEITSFPSATGTPPGGAGFPEPSRDQYEVAAEVRQLVWDGGRNGLERAAERARGEELRAEVDVALAALREQVDDAFFGALMARERMAQLELLAESLEARRRTLEARAAEGSGLASDAAEVGAEVLGVRQEIAAAEAQRAGALAALEGLTGIALSPGDVLALPDLSAMDSLSVPGAGDAPPTDRGDAVVAARAGTTPSFPAGPPELVRSARARARLSREADLAAAAVRPEVTAFVRGAWGRPGLDLLDDAFGPHAILGFRAIWSPFDWGDARGRAAVLRTEAARVRVREEALVASLERRADAIRSEIEGLRNVLALDDSIVALRERVETVARTQLEEGVRLASAYVSARNELFEARLRRRTHRLSLAAARARLAVLLGVPIPPGGEVAVELRPPVPDTPPDEEAIRP